MTTQNLLVELFVEELPPKALKKLGEAFAQQIYASLSDQWLIWMPATIAQDSDQPDPPAMDVFASPRRLGVLIRSVLLKAPDTQKLVKLMPVIVGLDAAGQATPALLKKLQALGADLTDPVAAVAALRQAPDGKAEALFYDSLVTGATLDTGLQKALEEAIRLLPIPKVMSYQLEADCELPGWSSVNFVRPAHGLVALRGSTVVPVKVLGLKAGNSTQGHRFEAKVSPVVIADADRYAATLAQDGAVMASFDERRNNIVQQLAGAAAALGRSDPRGSHAALHPIEDEALLDEVTALVERPNVLICAFETQFLGVPQECLILTMKANQKYFPLLDAAGKLTHQFLVVSNISPSDASAVIGGNERVVRPRLADAKFFFDQDRKKTLESRLSSLDKVVYHNKLGSQSERTERVRAITKAIGQQLGGDDLAAKADQAAQLAKADLVTDMVGEFPELQGIMGRYYAQHERLDNDVAFAIEDHYKPRFAGDELPRNQVGICVALADKLETLVGMFGIGNVPTGDKDPFALRRHALGVIRMLSEAKLAIGIEPLLKITVAGFGLGLLQLEYKEKDVVMPLWLKLQYFLQERATGYLKDLGYAAQDADAVIYMSIPAEYIARLEAINKARMLFPAEFDLLANADKRARNIINKSGMPSEVLLTDDTKLVEVKEKVLLAKTRELRGGVDRLATIADFEEALLLTVQISTPVTEFFDSVMVNADDEELRLNRFRLLHEVTGLTNRVADLSKLAS